MSRRQRKRGEAYRARRFVRRHPDLVANALEVASRSALVSVVAPFIGRAAAERLDEYLSEPVVVDDSPRPSTIFRNVTGQSLESAGLTNLEYRGPAGERFPLEGLVVRHGETIEEALRADLAKRGEGWTVWFVTPAAS